jgi:hypothetical protein
VKTKKKVKFSPQQEKVVALLRKHPEGVEIAPPSRGGINGIVANSLVKLNVAHRVSRQTPRGRAYLALVLGAAGVAR